MATSPASPTRRPVQRRAADPSDAPDQRPHPGRSIEKKAADAPDDALKKPVYRRPWFLVGAAVLLVLALFFGIRYYRYSAAHETTDNAFIEGDAVRVSPRTAGTVRRVYVRDNQLVQVGTLLLELDPTDYQAQLKQAQAAVTSAQAQRTAATKSAASQRSVIDQRRAALAGAAATVAQTRAQQRAAQAQAASDARDEQRYAELYRTDAVSRQRYDQALTVARASAAQAEAAGRATQATAAQAAQARAAVAQAQNDFQQSNEQISVADAQIGEAQATADATALQLSYTKLYATEAGHVTRKAVDQGQTVAVGQQLMVISYGQLWVTANFKETQLTNMRAGQPVELVVDAYPDEKFRGKVQSFQRGTGARFSLLPPENATGNYVKVVQRVPVKIVFDGQPNLYLLGPGMSVAPAVDISAAPAAEPSATTPNGPPRAPAGR